MEQLIIICDLRVIPIIKHKNKERENKQLSLVQYLLQYVRNDLLISQYIIIDIIY